MVCHSRYTSPNFCDLIYGFYIKIMLWHCLQTCANVCNSVFVFPFKLLNDVVYLQVETFGIYFFFTLKL